MDITWICPNELSRKKMELNQFHNKSIHNVTQNAPWMKPTKRPRNMSAITTYVDKHRNDSLTQNCILVSRKHNWTKLCLYTTKMRTHFFKNSINSKKESREPHTKTQKNGMSKLNMKILFYWVFYLELSRVSMFLSPSEVS